MVFCNCSIGLTNTISDDEANINEIQNNDSTLINESESIYGRETILDDSESVFDISTVHDSILSCVYDENDMSNSSMSAPDSLDFKLSPKGMNIGHLNIQGIQAKVDQLNVVLNSSQNDIHVLGLSETKLKDFHSDQLFMIDNYTMFRKNRVQNERRMEAGGGLIIYVKNTVRCVRRNDLEQDDIECMFIEIFPPNSRSFIIGNIYRHPNENIHWNEIFETQIEKVLEADKELYLLGDFNRDLLNENIKRPWIEYMDQFGLFQLVTEPTRQTEHSSTLIDHIYCNMPSNVISVKTPKVGISDHFPIFLTRKINFVEKKSSHYTISYRSFKNFNEAEFMEELKNTPWDVIKIFDNTDEVLDVWSSMYLDIVNKHLPVKKHRVKNKHQPKWITPEIIEAIKIRDRYKSLNDTNQYKNWRNKVSKLIKKSKKEQYKNLINENSNKPSSVWKIFKELGATKQNSKQNIISVKIDGKEIEDSDAIANEFNKYFVTVASTLKDNEISEDYEPLKNFCESKIPADESFKIPDLTQDKVEKYLKNLDVSKATGSDNISARLLKLSAPHITESITHICNESIKNSLFPQEWKEGKVSPLFKSGAKDDLNNYRPISVLPILSKLLEKHVHDSLMEYLNSFGLLHSTQSGFRANHSCETALVGMIDNWLTAINKNSMVGVVMIDFRKAFDLVDHNILLKKLKHYKMSENTLNWFSSYLINRKQRVFVNDTVSEAETILNGVPQGSILGPLLFLLFINDLPLYTGDVQTDLYADDTTLSATGKTQEDIKVKLQLALDRLKKWCKSNGMVINTTKTKVMLITTKQRKSHLENNVFSLTYENDDLSSTSNEKILGVHVDDTLDWTFHIDNISKKIKTNLWLLSRIKAFLTLEHRVQFYKTYIQPHIDYCNVIWGCTSQNNLYRIYNLQKRACKVILDYNVQNVNQSMKDLKILNIYDRVFLRKSKFMHKVANQITPSYINEMVQMRNQVDDMPFLRSVSHNNFIPPKPKKEIFKRSMSYSGPLVWNSLPNDIKQINNKNTFHKHCIYWMTNAQRSLSN